jgi:hypothetical protein
MRMIPEVPSHNMTGSEVEVFHLLEKMKLPDGIGLASLNLSEHEYKKWGEIDFVVLSTAGLLALEVKGGQVHCENGIWRYESRRHAPVERFESPIAQVCSAYFSLRDKHLVPALGKSFLTGVPMGFAAVFAHTSYKDAEARGLIGGTEMPKVLVATMDDLINPTMFEAFLLRVLDYWRRKIAGSHRRLKPQEVSTVAAAMRPWFDRVSPLSLSVAKIRQEQLTLTTEQYGILDFSCKADRLICIGGAGCGKTLLAVEYLRRERARDPIFVTGTDSLARYLRVSCAAESSRIYSFCELAKVPLQKRHRHASLIVDEGQQITDVSSLALLSQFLEGGIEEGRWRWFCDPNNQILPDASFDPKVFQFLKNLSFVGTLSKNCRTTPQIAHAVQMLTGAPIGESTVKGQGPEVFFVKPAPLDEQMGVVAEQINKWLEDPEIYPEDIILLSPRRENDWSIPLIANQAGLSWCRWEARGNVSRNHQGKLSAATIEEFRGLESPFVVLCDMDEQVDQPMGNFYLGMTRANFALMVVAHENVIQKLVKAAGHLRKA